MLYGYGYGSKRLDDGRCTMILCPTVSRKLFRSSKRPRLRHIDVRFRVLGGRGGRTREPRVTHCARGRATINPTWVTPLPGSEYLCARCVNDRSAAAVRCRVARTDSIPVRTCARPPSPPPRTHDRLNPVQRLPRPSVAHPSVA